MASGDTAPKIEFTAVPKSDYCTTRMATMWQHRQDELFTDFIIKVKDKSIPCHKVVMSAACDYFATALTSEFKEKHEGQICMEEMDADVMGNIVKYCYGQNTTFKMETFDNLLDAVELLQMKELKDQVEGFMIKNISVDCCVLWWKVSCKYKMDSLRNASIKIMSSHVTAIGGADEFKQLNFEELLTLIKEESLQLNLTDQLLMACIEWVDYEPLTRKVNVFDIIKNIRLKDCSLDTLRHIDKKYQDLVHDAKVYRILLNEMFDRKLVDHTVKEKTKECLVVLGGMRGKSVNTECYIDKSLGAFRWQTYVSIEHAALNKRSPLVCLNDGFIVLCGGPTKKKNTKYNANNKTWSDLPDSPVGLYNGSAVMCNNNVYLLGGEGPLDSVYKLDLALLTWHQEANMLDKQAWPIVATLGNRIYVVFNSVNNKRKTSFPLQVFSSQTAMPWKYKSSIPNDVTSTWGASLVATLESLFLISSYQCFKTAHYLALTDTWTLLKPPSVQHNFGSAAYHQGKIYLVGNTGDNEHSNASIYDTEKDEWKVVPVNLPLKQISFCELAVVQWPN